MDLLTLKMITTFRSWPLVGFGTLAIPMVLAAVLFTVMAVVAASEFQPSKAEALVFPGSALICAGAAFYLLMLGLVSEVALNAERESANEVPTAWEVR